MNERSRVWSVLARAVAFVRSAEPPLPVSPQAYTADFLVAAGFTCAAVAAGTPHRALGPLLVVLTTAPLALRRYCPLAAFWTVVLTIIGAYSGASGATLVTFLTVTFAAYSAVVHSRYRGAALISMPLAAALLMAVFPNTAPPVPGRATPLMILIPIMIVGNAVHMWTRRAGDSSARLRQAQAEHEEATRRALERERARIASELHDVVTHNVSVMVVQAGAARQVLPDDPGEAVKALLAVESSGRAALTELRHLLGLLSPATGCADGAWPAGPPNGAPGNGAHPNGAAALAPQPGLDEVRSLVGRVADAGLPVVLRVRGTPTDLPSGLGLAAYRVVQEALTNVLKHAGKPVTLVRLSYGPDELVIEVIDDGRPIPAAGPAGNGVPGGSGMGLLGLRERLRLYGGELAAGPRSAGGWLLTARIPVETSVVSPS